MQQPPASHPPVVFESRPKQGGVRILCRLDRPLADEYSAAVARVAPHVERGLAAGVLAHRVAMASREPPSILLQDWREERRSFRVARGRLRTAALVAHADVADCYASISVVVVEEALRRCRADTVDVSACGSLLRRLTREGVRGLPVGPVASAVLANAVLATADRALVRRGIRFVRWVDDWWIGVRSPEHADEALGALEAALASAGLRLNERKTRVGRPRDVAGAPSGAGYHRAADAHAVPVLARANAFVPGDGGMAAGGRPPRRARGKR
jgi:hypothetical protein